MILFLERISISSPCSLCLKQCQYLPLDFSYCTVSKNSVHTAPSFVLGPSISKPFSSFHQDNLSQLSVHCFLMRTLTYISNFPNIISSLQTPSGLHLCLICLRVSEMLHVFYRYAVTVLMRQFLFFLHTYIGFLFMSILILFEVLITSYFAKVGSVA